MSAVGLRHLAPAGHRAAPAGPSDRALDRLASRAAIALRLTSAITCVIVSPIAATAGVSAGWLAVVIPVLCGWSAAFAWRVHRTGLSQPMVLADIAVIAAVVATQGHVVPAGLTAAADCPAGQLLKVDWAWGTAGWLGVLVLLRRPLAELLGLLALEAPATFTILPCRGCTAPT